MRDGEVDGHRDGRSVERPTVEAAAGAVESSLEDGRAVALVGDCEVVDGDTEPSPPVARLVLLKPDGSAVVHAAGGPAPEAVLADAGDLVVSAADGVLEVGTAGESEDRRLRFHRVDRLFGLALEAAPDASTAGTPAARTGESVEGRHTTLRDRLVAEPERLESGFRPLATERQTSAGRVDLFGRDAEGRAVVVEVKGGRAGPAAVGQLDRYVSALRRDLHADAEVRGVLVAPSATDRTRALLDERGFDFRRLQPE